MGIAGLLVYGCKIGTLRQFCTHIQHLPREILMSLDGSPGIALVDSISGVNLWYSQNFAGASRAKEANLV
jgi:hypothetical protein